MTRIGCREIGILAVELGLILMAGLSLPAGAAAPVNDNFANATPLYGLTNFAVSNVGATAEPGEPAHAEAPAAYSLWWKWTVPFTASFSIVTSKSAVTNRVPLDTTLAVYLGDALTNLTEVVANDDTDVGEYGATWSRLVFRAYAGETLMIAADSIGTNGTIQMRISVAGPLAGPWQVTDLQGQLVSSTNFIGQVVMVDFWETTCAACVEELPDLIRLQDALHPRGFTIFGLSGDPDASTVSTYLAGRTVNYPIAMTNPFVQDVLTVGPVIFPTKLLLDRDGRIVGEYFDGHTEKYYEGLVEPLLRARPAVRVNIAHGNGGVSLSWPVSESGWRLETTANPVMGGWLFLSATPVATNSYHVVIVPATSVPQFYRLVKP